MSAFVAEENGVISRKTIALLALIETLTALIPAALAFFLADAIARAQNLPEAAGVYRSLCPSVVICAAYSVIRGTLLGKRAFVRSAFAEFISQAVKAIIAPVLAVAGGLISPRFIAPFAALGTLAAESAALIFALLSFFKASGGKEDVCDKAAVKRIYLKSLPVALTGHNNAAVCACRQLYRAGNFVPHFLQRASRLAVRNKGRRGGFSLIASLVGIRGGVLLFSARFIGKKE